MYSLAHRGGGGVVLNPETPSMNRKIRKKMRKIRRTPENLLHIISNFKSIFNRFFKSPSNKPKTISFNVFAKHFLADWGRPPKPQKYEFYLNFENLFLFLEKFDNRPDQISVYATGIYSFISKDSHKIVCSYLQFLPF